MVSRILETLKKKSDLVKLRELWNSYLSNTPRERNILSTQSRSNSDGISTGWKLKWENLDEKEIRDRLTHDRRIITIDTLPKNIGGTLHERNRANPNNHNGNANHPIS